ncbi:MAG: hypothetical protein H3C34_04910 [Caldilineaceae bacterium]|nr:hypothetical protein [Caldilineaceae bacterium]
MTIWLALLLLMLNTLPLHAAPALSLEPADFVCFVTESAGISMRSSGYLRHDDGIVDIYLEVDTDSQPLVEVAVSGHNWQPRTPEGNTIYVGNSGQWTVRANLGLAAVTGVTLVFRPADSESATTAREQFRLRVAEFVADAPLFVQVKTTSQSVSLGISLHHPACDRRRPPPVPPPAGAESAVLAWLPTYQSHVVLASDFDHTWTEEERSVLWDAGLPVPDVATALIDLFALDTQRPALAQKGSPLLLGGWTRIFHQTFDRGSDDRFADGQCRPIFLSDDVRTRWTPASQRTFRRSIAALAPETATLPVALPGQDVSPEPITVQLVCVFDDLFHAQNLMVQFALWMDRGSEGDTLFAGFSTDGQTFFGRRWRNSYRGSEGAHIWGEQRIFFPFTGDRLLPAEGRVAVLIEYRSDRTQPAAAGPVLDELIVERYDPLGIPCRSADPAIVVPGAPGAGRVSKGVNLPPYLDRTPSGSRGVVERLRAVHAGWVRLEFQAPIHPLAAPAIQQGSGARLNYIDLKHYDSLVDDLCSGGASIAILGLLDYHILPEGSWRAQGTLSPEYLAAFVAQTQWLVRYYRERVRAWEIWNEPDYRTTYLQPAAFTQLLTEVHSAIKGIDPAALVVSGGLGGADNTALGYLRQVIAVLPAESPPYDVFAIHPYPSQAFRRNGEIIRDPSYLRSTAPTVLAPFMELMRQAGQANMPIWITEIGWNRAADSENSATLTCQLITATMVTGEEQSRFLAEQFDILFTETAWAPDVPAVTKVFWYQYIDTGVTVRESDCQASRQAAMTEEQRVVDWWFGLYSGTDPGRGIFEPVPLASACTFRAYPDAAAIQACLEKTTGQPAGSGAATARLP